MISINTKAETKRICAQLPEELSMIHFGSFKMPAYLYAINFGTKELEKKLNHRLEQLKVGRFLKNSDYLSYKIAHAKK